MNRSEHREFTAERIARIEERMISISNDVSEMKVVVEKSFSSFGDIANRVSSLESFKKSLVLIASAIGSFAGIAFESLFSMWKNK
jgi:hypothetical protein